ncbi:MAG: sugar phosphate isomerase/epimerase family protein, partial [Oscillospiraceae bacterium]
MVKAKIGVQMMVLRQEVIDNGVYTTLKKLSETGFNCIEVSQIEMSAKNVDEIKKACDDFGITIAALSAAVEPMMPGMESLTTNFDKIIQDCKTLRCNYLRVGMLPFNYIGSLEKAMEFAKKAEEMAVRLEEHGIKLYYHNHHIEFIKYDGKYLLDIIRDNTEKLGFEIDVHWVQRGGENPVEFIKGYEGRLELLHLKDYKVVSPDFTDLSPTDMKKFMQVFTDVIRFAEIGEGTLDFNKIVDTGMSIGAKFLI